MDIGILDLQGAVEPHRKKLESLGANTIQVKNSRDLKTLSGIILPGGESTTMIHLLKLNQLWEDLAIFVSERPAWGICAGAILLAERVTSPAQESLHAMEITVERNAYGRQVDSFIDRVQPTSAWLDRETLEGVFIRAPIIKSFGVSVKSLFTYAERVVMVQQGNKLASTFHPELSDSLKIHQYFLSLCEG
jgi:5'-phosphate synthase pdxT subunit